MFGLKKNNISNCVELREKVDPEGFRLVTSGLQPLLCPAVYREENGRHILEFQTSEMSNLGDSTELPPEWISSLLLAYCGVIRLALERELPLQNFRWDKRCICFDKHGFRFQYVPHGDVRGSTNLRALLSRLLKEIPTRDPRIPELLRGLKRCGTDEACLQLLEDAAGVPETEEPFPAETEEPAGAEPPVWDEGDSEAETTGLSPGFSPPRVNRDGPDTAYIDNSFDESETTVLSALPNGVPIRPRSAEKGDRLILVRTSTGERIRVRGSYFLVGSDTHNMDYTVQNSSVSRHHATITFENDTYYIMDNKSTNGTLIEGVRIPPYDKVELTDGAILTLGSEVFQTEIGRG